VNPERWQVVKKVLADALERTPEERSIYLDHACTDPDLRREVESLIAAHDQEGASLPAIPSVATTEALESGTKLGPYTILARIGAGGMGEVYKAHDPKLRRDVAIKVLPRTFIHDSERLARFQREARMLASLTHPNIAAIYGLEDSGDTHALVMELAEGPTLADRIRQGPIPVDEALPIARQIADALEYAHEKGIVHRDLKPANVKVASDETVKILDFGLAKAMETELSAEEIADSPTISQMATEAGVLLGTAAYMSPEQAKAKPVDRRADIWAFGCVLYEMLTGKRTFRGESVTDTLAAVLKNEPDWSLLPAETPPHVRILLLRCLQKDARQRLQAMGDARIALDEVLSGVPTLVGPAVSPRRALRWAMACVLAGLLSGTAVWILKPAPASPPRPVTRFEIHAPEKSAVGDTFALSPDGRKLAFTATGADFQSRIWVRSLETLEARPLDGTEGARVLPFWSPDSRYIAFAVHGKLMRIEASGGPPLTICDALEGFGGAWTRDDKIVFGSAKGLFQVAASGGSPSPITTGGAAATPSLLPDERHVVYWRLDGIYVADLKAKPQEQSSKKLLPDSSMVVYAPSSDPSVGYLLFVRGPWGFGTVGTLMAQPFDTRRLELTGEAVPITGRVPNWSFSASGKDALAYATRSDFGVARAFPGFIQGQLTWFDRAGKILGAVGESGIYRSVALSPDGKRVAFERVDPQNSGIVNIWLYEFARDATTRFTFDSGWDALPVWSPDGSHIAFGSERGGLFDLYQKTSNLAGEDELLLKTTEGSGALPSSWSSDGRFLLYSDGGAPNRMWLLPVGGEADRKSVRLDTSQFNEADSRFSPDGRWIAYSSDESGNNQVYVRPFDTSAATGSPPADGTSVIGKWMVSKDGGLNPMWRRDGKELFYLSAMGGTAMAVEVNTGDVFQAGVPKQLFKVPAGVLFWDVSADGNKFLMAAPSGAGPTSQPQPPFTVVLNWQAALKK